MLRRDSHGDVIPPKLRNLFFNEELVIGAIKSMLGVRDDEVYLGVYQDLVHWRTHQPASDLARSNPFLFILADTAVPWKHDDFRHVALASLTIPSTSVASERAWSR